MGDSLVAVACGRTRVSDIFCWNYGHEMFCETRYGALVFMGFGVVSCGFEWNMLAVKGQCVEICSFIGGVSSWHECIDCDDAF